MIQVELTPDQAELLQAVLDSALRDLREEIRHTDRRDFRDMLKSQAASLDVLRHSLAGQPHELPA